MKRLWWLVVVLFGWCGEDLYFQRITEEDGLPNNTVLGIEQDLLGFLWITTSEGVARYDGETFETFKADALMPNSIVGNLTLKPLLTSWGDAWIPTVGRGLNKFDYETETFSFFKPEPNNPNSLSDHRIQSMSVDRHGMIWIGTFDGLNQLDPETDVMRRFYCSDGPDSVSSSWISYTYEDSQYRMWIGTHDGGLNFIEQEDGSETLSFKHYVHDPNDPYSLTDGRVTSVLEDGNGVIWVSTELGLNRLDKDTGGFLRILPDPAHPRDRSANAIQDIFEDRRGQLWVVFARQKLARYDGEGEKLVYYELRQGSSLNRDDSEISFMYEGVSGDFWVGVKGGGLRRYRPDTDSFVSYQAEFNDPLALSSDYVISIYEDPSGILYVGTWLGGLNKHIPIVKRFGLHRPIPEQVGGLSSKAITSFYEPPGTGGRMLWIGAWDGLQQWDRSTGLYRGWRHDPTNPSSISGDQVRSILGDQGHEEELLWVGTEFNGLNRFHVPTGKFTRFVHEPGDSQSFGGRGVFSLYQDRSGSLWVGTFDHGLERFNRDSQTFRHFPTARGVQGALQNSRVTTMLEDVAGNFWVGTDAELHRLDRQTEEFTAYDGFRNGLFGIQAIVQADEPHKLWVGVILGGLHLFNKKTGLSEVYTEKSGLCHNYIVGIQKDRMGRLWIATANGLSQFDPETEHFNNYDVGDGLQGNRFFWTATFQSTRGEMFFGGFDGFNAFFPDRIQPNPHGARVVFNDFKVANVSQKPGPDSPLQKHIKLQENISLSYKQNVFSFKYTGLDHARPGRITYAHKMDGFEEDWNYVGKSKDARFTNLKPGSYAFQVKAANGDGIWGNPAAVNLIIQPPPWKTGWFYVLEVILGLAFLTFLFWMQRRVLDRKRKQELLENDLSRKTREKELAEAANLSKTRFLANMSHEIRSPLNAIVGFSQILMKQAGKHDLPKEFGHYLENIQTSGRNLSELINNILDLSKIEAGKMALSREDLNLKLLVQGIYHIFKQKAAEKGVVFNYNYEGNLATLIHSDRTRLNQILVNLVDNAIKFTSSGKNVWLRAGRDGSSIVLEVQDQGIGIDPSKHKSVFQAFEQADAGTTRNFGGTGLGLAITARMVNLLGGDIQLESALGEGSTFTVRIPFTSGSAVATPQIGELWTRVGFHKNSSILVVDDNVMNREMAQALFSEMGLKVHLAAGGAEAVDLALRLKPNLVFLDLHMPEVSGYEALRRIRRHSEGADMKIVAFSADAFREQQVTAREAGFNGFLTKPLEMDRLMPLLMAYLPHGPENSKLNARKLLPSNTELDHIMREALQKLADIPHFLTSDILKEIKDMSELCQDYESSWPSLLAQIKEATLSCDAERAGELIRQALH